MYMAGVLFLGVAAVVLLGWVLPLAVGLVRRARGRSCVGWLVFGGVWGFFGLCGLVLAGIGLAAAARSRGARSEIVTFDPAAAGEAGVATILFPYAYDVELTARDRREHRMLRLTGTNGCVHVPAGGLDLISMAVSGTDEAGAAWHARSYLGGRVPDVDLARDAVAELAYGPPFTARVNGRVSGEGVLTLDLVLQDGGGRPFTIRRARGGGSPPRFELRDATDAVVLGGRFEYG